MKRVALFAMLLPAGFGMAQIASSAPPVAFCDRKPNHPRCLTTAPTSAPPPTTTVAPPTTTTPPPPTTTAPTSTGTANLWIVP